MFDPLTNFGPDSNTRHCDCFNCSQLKTAANAHLTSRLKWLHYAEKLMYCWKITRSYGIIVSFFAMTLKLLKISSQHIQSTYTVCFFYNKKLTDITWLFSIGRRKNYTFLHQLFFANLETKFSIYLAQISKFWVAGSRVFKLIDKNKKIDRFTFFCLL